MTYHGKSREELIAEIERLKEWRAGNGPAMDISPLTVPQTVELAQQVQAIALSMNSLLRSDTPGDVAGLKEAQKAVVGLIEDNADLLSSITRWMTKPLSYIEMSAEEEPRP